MRNVGHEIIVCGLLFALAVSLWVHMQDSSAHADQHRAADASGAAAPRPDAGPYRPLEGNTVPLPLDNGLDVGPER